MKKTITTTLLVVFYAMSWSQLTITADGAKAESANCSMDDVKLSMPLPSNYAGYDLVNITLRLFIPEHGPGAQIGAGCYYTEFSNTYFEGKKSIDLQLTSSEKNSDFKEGEYPYYALNYVDLYEVCNDPMRKYTYINAGIEVRGAKHAGYEWRNGVQVKTYTYEVLNTYNFKYDLGALNDFYNGTMNKYRIDKVKYGSVEFTNYGNSSIIYFKDQGASKNANESMDMGMGEPESSSNNGQVILHTAILNASEASVEEVKSGVHYNLISTTNSSFNLSGYNIPFDHSGTFNISHKYWPVAGGAKPLNSEAGQNSKLKNIGGAFGAGAGSKTETKAAIDKILADHKAYFTWTTKSMDGVEFQKLEIEVYESEQATTDDAWACKLYEGEEGKTRKLVILVGQKGDFIYCLAIFKSAAEGLSTNEKAFFDHVESTFKFM